MGVGEIGWEWLGVAQKGMEHNSTKPVLGKFLTVNCNQS